MPFDQFGQSNESGGQPQQPANATGVNPPTSQTEPIPPVESQAMASEPVAPDMPINTNIPTPESNIVNAGTPSVAPPGSDYVDNVLGGGAVPQPGLPEAPPVSNIPTPGSGMPQVDQLPEEKPGLGRMEAGDARANKYNLWLPIVVLIIVAAAAAVYFLFINKPSKNEQPTGVLLEEPTEVSTATQNSDTTKKEDLINIQKALEQYYQANQEYPVSENITKTQDSNGPLSVLMPDYLKKLPIDPSGADAYYGYKSEDGKTYELSAIFTGSPAGIKSTQVTKGYLVVLNPGLTFENTK